MPDMWYSLSRLKLSPLTLPKNVGTFSCSPNSSIPSVSTQVYPIPCSAAFLLGELVEANNRSEAAQSIVRLFMNKGSIVHLLRALGEDEISNTQDPTVLFRGNTVATKCIDEFMKIAGGHYLHYTLK